METKQKLPKWFNGMLYTEGDTVTNPFSGESYKLTAAELSMYDFIIGCSMTGRMQNLMAKGLSWFRQNNAKAYFILLD